jgi:hypothetical protein
VSAEAALLAIGLLNFADDEGYFRYIPKLIESKIFPLRELSKNIPGMIQELSEIGYLSLKTDPETGKEYGKITKFDKHQRVDKPKTSEIKELGIFQDNSENVPRTINEGKEGKGRERKESKTIPPKFEWVKSYCEERQNGIDPQKFIDHYEANNWMRGKSKVKDWQACIRTWEGKRENSTVEFYT